MSCPNMVWALYRPGLTSAERSVLVHMANMANRALVCYDPMQKIARLLEMSIRTVHRAVHALQEKGFLRIQARHRTSSYYHLLIPSEDAERRNTQPPGSDNMSQEQPEVSDNMSVQTPVQSDNLSLKEPVLHDNLAGVSPKEESPKAKGKIFSKSFGEGSKPEREPTVAAVEANRKAEAIDLKGLPAGIAAAVMRVHGLAGKALEPGSTWACRSVRTRNEQVDAVNSAPARKPHYLTPEQLQLVRSRAGVQVRQAAYA